MLYRDVLFVLDATASMGPYLDSAKRNLLEICQFLHTSGRLRRGDGLQVGLITYSDYDAGPDGPVAETVPLTFDLSKFKNNLLPLNVYESGDLPEAFSTALEYAYKKMNGWRDNVKKAIVFVTDAAPHGIGESDDFYVDGAPKGE